MKTRSFKKDKVNVVTLGCSKNLVDSEVMMHQLRANGISVEHESKKDDSNIVIVNTCGFIDRAKEESIQTILDFASIKESGDLDKLYVTGCLSQRYRDELKKEIPEVDAWFGTLELPALLERFNADYKSELLGERSLTTPPHYAYVKISEGCNRKCSFCAIPLMRGKHISKPIEELVTEVSKLAANGVKEVMLIAQELTFYGLDIYKKRRLPELLEAFNDIDGIEWIRLHYAYPSQFPIDIIHAMAKLPKVCNYLDMPLQHASSNMLKSMKRNIDRPKTELLLNEIRSLIPDIAIRTTMMVGFPGETEEDFQELCDFVQEQRFERLGVFTYSHEESTKAHDLEDDIDPELKNERAAQLMEIQESISYEKNQEKIGKTMKVLFDRVEGQHFIGRTESDSPEVDNEVLVDSAKNFARIGDFADVKIESADAFDLFGNIISEK
ncbi:MAG: 30S ribosomal protein S12 methylthiotransferase RimO [Chitinophagales bacterium]|nr:30S ribosomal protein S12 methylthiotransferase RimO [Chitinophagales bacterium]